ncbi:MAG TPA: hypothetical protein PLO37_13470 [Candidatus Hydrogenedentes bacterium]|nr:hypothetical protein [Candidatus Hydrogenedentota bacterium]HPG67853.1 hypothetical protein [Candidatus Hydrogenedentota bacterium]
MVAAADSPPRSVRFDGVAIERNDFETYPVYAHVDANELIAVTLDWGKT